MGELDCEESWVPKNWCFWTVVLEKTLESPLDSLLSLLDRHLRVPRRYNQSILKEISPTCSLEGLILKLKLQYFGHLMWRADSFEKTLMLGKIEGRRRRGQQRMRWLNGITDSMEWGWVSSGIGDEQGGVACWGSWGHKELDMTEWLNWTELNYTVHGILQARILEWVTFPFYRRSSQSRDRTQVSRTAGGFFTSWATREAFCTLGHPFCPKQCLDFITPPLPRL